MKHTIFLAVVIWGFCLNAIGQEKVDYKPSDSLRVTSLLKQARHLGKDKNLMIYFARQLRGIPYVAKTLEVNPSEQLVVNLRQLDCTTYVETVMALTLCAREQSIRFEDYCRWLRTIRYEQGKIGYTRRLHYFTSWIDDNTEMGLIKEISHKGRPFTGRQRLNIDFMSTHSHLYPMLHGKAKAIKEIRDTEQKLTGRIVAYIPKKSIDNSTLMRQTGHYHIQTRTRHIPHRHRSLARRRPTSPQRLTNKTQSSGRTYDARSIYEQASQTDRNKSDKDKS